MDFRIRLMDLLAALVLGGFAAIGTGCLESTPTNSTSRVDLGNQPALSFTDVTAKAGLDDFVHKKGNSGHKWAPEPVGGGGGFFDYNGDGWLDILLVAGGSWEDAEEGEVSALALYRNNGDGTFTEWTRRAGLAEVRAYGFGIAAADYDNDGDQDFVLTTLRENKLFRNDNGVFTEVGKEAGIAGSALWSTSALFFDADRDGHLDLFVCNYVDWSPEEDVYCGIAGEKAYCTPQVYDGVPSQYYRNNGDGSFTEMTDAAGLVPNFDSALDKSLGVTQFDYNRDGWPDLIVANDTEQDMLYENDGDGTFTEKGRRAGIAFNAHGTPRAGMGVDAGVVDSSGQTSIFVGNFSEEMVGVYRYSGRETFVDRATISRIGHPSLNTLTFGLFLFDVDYDGDLDLFAANGHVQPRIEQIQENIPYRQPPQLYLNDGGGHFQEVDKPIGGLLEQPLVARGAAYGDYDNDGDVDVLLTENNGPVHLWRNDMETPSFLRVRLAGRQSNRDGIGGRVIAAKDGLQMERIIRTGSSYLSQSEKVAAFGLGAARRVDSLAIHWPSGQKDVFYDVAGNQYIKIIEDSGEYVPVQTARSSVVAHRQE